MGKDGLHSRYTKNGVLKNVSVSDETDINANGSAILTANTPTTEEYKIMVWDSMNNMMPL